MQDAGHSADQEPVLVYECDWALYEWHYVCKPEGLYLIKLRSAYSAVSLYAFVEWFKYECPYSSSFCELLYMSVSVRSTATQDTRPGLSYKTSL